MHPTPINESTITKAFATISPMRIDAGHAKLAYWRFGQGPDLVFVHGWPLHSATFRRVLPHLAHRYTCHLIDLPGAGASTWSADTPFGLEAHAATLRTALASLGLEQYMLVAHDSGAGVARFLAADDPAAVGLVSGPTEIPGHLSGLVSLYKLVSRLPAGPWTIQTLMGIGAVRRSPLGFSGCFTRADYVDSEFGTLFIEPLVRDASVLAPHLQMLRSFRRAEIDALREVHRRTTVPVRFALGDDDTIFPLRRAKEMIRQFGGTAELTVIPGARAFLHEDHPEAFAAEVRHLAERVLDQAHRASA